MIRLSFAPQFRGDTLTLSKVGDVLTINGEEINFSTLPEGATIKLGRIPCDWIDGPVDRVNGEIHVRLVLPFNVMPAGKVATRPDPITVTDDGPIALPEIIYVDA